MKLIICLDDKNGMMFNKRRQSKDVVVAEKVKEIIGNNLLHIHSYSSPIFPEATVCESFENIDGFAFIENPDYIIPEKVQELYIFKWNRHYPSDKKFKMDMSDFSLVSTEDFAGNSHENITLEIYNKR